MDVQQDVRKGAFYQVLAWFFFALMYLVSKMIADEASASVRLFFRGFIGTCFALPWMLKHGVASFRVASPGWMGIRAAAATINIALIFLAIETISLVDTTLLTNSAPFFVPLLAFFLLRKKMSRRLWMPIVLGFVGVIFVLKPTSQILQLGAFYALGSGVFTALSSISTREMRGSVPNHTVLFYLFFVSMAAMLPFALVNWEVASKSAYAGLVLIGVFAAIAQMFYYKSFERAEASHVAPFGYSCVVFSGLFDWFFFQDIPDVWTVLGMILVIASGLWILRRSRSL